MRESEGSRTALMTAFIRAAHQVFDGEVLILPDPIALKLLTPEGRERLSQANQPSNSAPARALRSYIVLRSRFTEDRLEAAVRRGVTQYILVGAGFDTFALRQPSWASGLRIIEVDHPATQAEKRKRIEDAGLQIPSNLRFADVNFEKESLLEGLLRHGVSIAEPSFFCWLGVSMYLTEAAIDSSLDGMARFPSGSELVMTFAPPRPTNTGAAGPLDTEAAQRLADIGEPFISFFEPAQIESKLLKAGFSKVEFLTPEQAKAKYYPPGTTPLPPPLITTIVAATK